MKTVYERFGASAQFEPIGYYCHACGIFYDKTRPKVVSVDNIAQTIYSKEQDRIQNLAEPYTRITWGYIRNRKSPIHSYVIS